MEINVVLPERLTGQTANLMGFARAGSNPAHDVFLLCEHGLVGYDAPFTRERR